MPFQRGTINYGSNYHKQGLLGDKAVPLVGHHDRRTARKIENENPMAMLNFRGAFNILPHLLWEEPVEYLIQLVNLHK
jgi:hypothetical protein